MMGQTYSAGMLPSIWRRPAPPARARLAAICIDSSCRFSAAISDSCWCILSFCCEYAFACAADRGGAVNCSKTIYALNIAVIAIGVHGGFTLHRDRKD